MDLGAFDEGITLTVLDVVPYLNALEQRSDFLHDWHVPSLLSKQNADRKVEFVRHGALLSLAFPDPGGEDIVRSLSGVASPESMRSMRGVSRLFTRVGVETAMSVEDCCSVLWKAVRDRRFDDYVFDLSEQIALQGQRFARRRGYLRKAASESWTFRNLNLALPETKTEMLGIQTRFLAEARARFQGAGTARQSLDEEDEVLRALVKDPITGCLGGVGVASASGRLRGFALFQVTGIRATALCVKADRLSQAYAATWQALFEATYTLGARELNGGHDGGLPGLRLAKTRLAPARMLESFSLFARG